MLFMFFFVKQKTAYGMRISDWSSDVCSSDLCGKAPERASRGAHALEPFHMPETMKAYHFDAFNDDLASLTLHDDPVPTPGPGQIVRSEARRVGNACVSTCRSRW